MKPTTQARPPTPLAELVDRVPEGWTLVAYEDRPYGLSRTTRANGRSVTILARELGGPDLVSANIYTTSKGHQLRACEMPDHKVLSFLAGWKPRTSSPGSPERTRPQRDTNRETRWTHARSAYRQQRLSRRQALRALWVLQRCAGRRTHRPRRRSPRTIST